MDIRNISSINAVPQTFKSEKVENTNLLKEEAPNDSVEFQHKKEGKELTKEDKQEIVRSARTDAAGWSIIGGELSLLYFALRSDKTVAKKYDLDAEKDKKLIKQIKREQTLWTLPGLIQGVGLIPSIVAWSYNKNMDPSKIKVDEA